MKEVFYKFFLVFFTLSFVFLRCNTAFSDNLVQFSQAYGESCLENFFTQREGILRSASFSNDMSIERFDLDVAIDPPEHRMDVVCSLKATKRKSGDVGFSLTNLPQAGITVSDLKVLVNGSQTEKFVWEKSMLVFPLPAKRSDIIISYSSRMTPKLPTMLPHLETDSGSLPGMFSPFPISSPEAILRGTVKVHIPKGYLVAGPGTPSQILMNGLTQIHHFFLNPPSRAFSFTIAYISGRELKFGRKPQIRLLVPQDFPEDLGTWGKVLQNILKTAEEILGPVLFPEVYFVALPHMTELQGKGCGNVILLGGKKVFCRPSERIPYIVPFVCHEFLHLYFGTMVNSDLKNFFFSEAITQYITHQCIKKMYPEKLTDEIAEKLGIETAEDTIWMQDFDMYKSVFQKGQDVPLSTHVFSEENKNVVYGKGTMFLLNLASKTKPKVFNEAIRELVATHCLKDVLDWHDFYRKLVEKKVLSEPELEIIFTHWLFETKIPRSACSEEFLSRLEKIISRQNPPISSSQVFAQ